MRKKVVIIVLASVAVLAGPIWFNRVTEPLHKGVRIGSFLDKKAATPGVGLGEVQEAARVLGAKAVPYLASVLECEPTWLQEFYSKLHARLPAAGQKLAPAPKNFNQRRAWAAAALTQAGTNAIPAIPVLMKAARNDRFFGTRHNAIGTLAAIAPGTPFEAEAAAVVIGSTSDPNRTIREHAFSSLGAFTNQLRTVVPILLHGLRNPAVKESAMVSLKRLGKDVMLVVRERVQNEGYLPMSFEELERQLTAP